jgi:putative transposase
VSGRPRVCRDNIGQVSDWVEQTGERSGLPVRTVLARLGVAPSSYYRIRARDRASEGRTGTSGSGRHNAYALLSDERMLILDYALTFPDPRHRALAWEMTDAGVVCASPSSVYRVLKSKGLVPEWRMGWSGSSGQPVPERATHPDERWLIDYSYIWSRDRWRYLFYLMDEYSRYVVYWELGVRMDRYAASAAVERALVLPGRNRLPEVRTDNGPAFKSAEFRCYLAGHGIVAHRSRPHCPEDNGIIERGIRTLKELAGAAFDGDCEAETEIGRAVDYYNRVRRHSALYYLRPADYYRGDPDALLAERGQRIRVARQERRLVNLRLVTRPQDNRTRVGKQAEDSSNPMPVLSQIL